MVDDTPVTPIVPKTEVPPAGNPKRRKSLTIILLVFAVVAVVGFFWWLSASQYEGTDDATLSAHVHPVSARIDGTVQEVLVDDNQLVKAGQLLAVLDPTNYNLAVQKANADLQAAKAKVAMAAKKIPWTQQQAISQIMQAQGGVGSSQSEIRQAHDSVSEAQNMLAQKEADFQNAQINYQRYSGVDPDAISAQQLDQAKTEMLTAKAARDAAQDAVRRAMADVHNTVAKLAQSQGTYTGAQSEKMQVDMAKSDYDSAVADMAEAQAAYDQAQLDLSYTRIYAPTAGRVGKKDIEVGQRIQIGEPLMAVVQSDVWIVANYKETQLERMRPGQPADITIDAFAHHHFTGSVDSFSPATGAEFALLPPENATGNFTKIVQRVPVKILLDADSVKGYESLLSPGLSVVVSVHVTAPGRGKSS